MGPAQKGMDADQRLAGDRPAPGRARIQAQALAGVPQQHHAGGDRAVREQRFRRAAVDGEDQDAAGATEKLWGEQLAARETQPLYAAAAERNFIVAGGAVRGVARAGAD